MKITKEQKGITLIALVITIIVLLILAGVVLNAVLNENILNNAQTAVDRYNEKASEEDALISQLDELLSQYAGGDNPPTPTPTPAQPAENYTITYNANGGTGTMEQATASTVAANGFTAPLGNGFKGWNTLADGSGTSYAPGDSVSSNLTLYAIWGGTYRLGEEVTIGTGTNAQSFYVLIDEGTSATNVTLLAKYNLDKNPDATTGKYYQKANAAYGDYACAFSSTNYWEEKWNQTESGVARRFDLNNETEYGAVAEGDAIDRAKNYAQNTLGLTRNAGRLLTYEETNALQSSYANMINGTANKQGTTSDYFLRYWLSSTYEDSYGNKLVYFVDGNMGGMYTYTYSVYSDAGIRPVIIASKSLIQ